MDGTRRRRWLLALVFALVGLFAVERVVRRQAVDTVAFSELAARVRAGDVRELEVSDLEVRAWLRAEAPRTRASVRVLVAERIPGLEPNALVSEASALGVEVRGSVERGSPWLAALLGALPFVLLAALLWGLPMALGGRGRPMSFGRSRAKLFDQAKESPVTFADVAGIDEAKRELEEVVRFLKEPARFWAMGARAPKGVLLVGAPGTGKTLLARAVAGESGVPFFSISGSEFVEMFVGVGASRVRDLFVQAKERAPCILFIDELDAVGKARAGPTGFAANEEREQTLNQLLVEMDGFDAKAGIVILAATNRPEILDRALLRAGRFDRQVVVDKPDLAGREAILRVHAQRARVGADVDLRVVAQRTPGMVGADLANVVNEAALACVRRGGVDVSYADFEEAVDRIQLGLKKEGRAMTEADRLRVAVHEAGHALVAASVGGDPVHRVSILPRTIGALGFTLQLPLEDRYVITQAELEARLATLLGGRAAEALVFRDASTGAADDLERATELARAMVTRFGMSDAVGPVSWAPSPGRFLPGIELEPPRYGEATARAIDEEVARTLRRSVERAFSVLADRRPTLDRLVASLLERETLTGSELAELLGEAPARGLAEQSGPRVAAMQGECSPKNAAGPANGACGARQRT